MSAPRPVGLATFSANRFETKGMPSVINNNLKNFLIGEFRKGKREPIGIQTAFPVLSTSQ